MHVTLEVILLYGTQVVTASHDLQKHITSLRVLELGNSTDSIFFGCTYLRQILKNMHRKFVWGSLSNTLSTSTFTYTDL